MLDRIFVVGSYHQQVMATQLITSTSTGNYLSSTRWLQSFVTNSKFLFAKIVLVMAEKGHANAKQNLK